MNSKNSSVFMETEHSLHCSQGPPLKPSDKIVIKIHFNIILPSATEAIFTTAEFYKGKGRHLNRELREMVGRIVGGGLSFVLGGGMKQKMTVGVSTEEVAIIITDQVLFPGLCFSFMLAWFFVN